MDCKYYASQVFETEAKAIADLTKLLTDDFDKAVESILNTKGRTIVCGMGKSGIVGKKIAATLASTGTPSFFMHPGEAFHGDLGMVTSDDVFLAVSNSGETEEVLKLLPFLKENKNVVIAITGNISSTLAKEAHFHLNVTVEQEACPLQLAPTSSTTATLVMGDALAVSLMEVRGFKPENFARFHPGGSLGRKLLRKVEDEMQASDLPIVAEDADIGTVISTITTGQLGLAIIMDDSMRSVSGIVTDGDLRRAIESYRESIFDYVAKDIMSKDPITVNRSRLIADAIDVMETHSVNRLLVMEQETLVGIFKK